MVRDLGRAEMPQAIQDAAQRAGVSSHLGRLAFAGLNSSGNTWVQFNDDATNTGYASAWPTWAFEPAKDALPANKRLSILANGAPFGGNLVSVLIFP